MVLNKRKDELDHKSAQKKWVKQSQISNDLTLSGYLAERLHKLISTGCFSIKPEINRIEEATKS
jgi:hypothetical protein